MVKKAAIFIFGLTLFFVLPVSAAMGAYNTVGHMTNHKAHIATHNSKSVRTMDSKTALSRMKMYMYAETDAGYQLKNFTDDGSYYKADILSPEGTLLNKLVVNKKTGHVYFTKN